MIDRKLFNSNKTFIYSRATQRFKTKKRYSLVILITDFLSSRISIRIGKIFSLLQNDSEIVKKKF